MAVFECNAPKPYKNNKMWGCRKIIFLAVFYHSAESVRKVTGFRARNVMSGTVQQNMSYALVW